jgi:hypothetical protein
VGVGFFCLVLFVFGVVGVLFLRCVVFVCGVWLVWVGFGCLCVWVWGS